MADGAERRAESGLARSLQQPRTHAGVKTTVLLLSLLLSHSLLLTS